MKTKLGKSDGKKKQIQVRVSTNMDCLKKLIKLNIRGDFIDLNNPEVCSKKQPSTNIKYRSFLIMKF